MSNLVNFISLYMQQYVTIAKSEEKEQISNFHRFDWSVRKSNLHGLEAYGGFAAFWIFPVEEAPLGNQSAQSPASV